LTKAYQSWSHNMTSDLIYMATGWSSSFIQAPTAVALYRHRQQ
jgi:hypothetical protein